MAGDAWRTLPFDEAVVINPPVPLERGRVYPFVDMQVVDPSSRTVGPSEFREFTGGGSRFAVGDTLMARITPCLENGKIARFRSDDAGPVGHGSTEFIVIRGREGVTDSEFAYYLTRWEGVRGYAVSQMTGSSGRQRVPTSALSHLEVAVPPIAEQRAIAHILGTLDDKIELNRRMAATLEAMARALFKSWFVDFEPVRAKLEGRWRRGQSLPGLPAHLYDLFPDSFQDSELGEIPTGWEAGPFREVVQQLRDQENPLSSPDVLYHHFSLPAYDDAQSPKVEFGETIKSLKWRVPSGVVLLSKLNPEIERVWLVDVRPSERAVCSTEFLVLLARAPFTRSFVYCLARSPLFRQQIEGLVTGTSKSHQRAQVESILNLAIVVPPSSLVAAFDRLAESLLARSLESRRESRTLAALRDALLPKLLSGEIDVSALAARPAEAEETGRPAEKASPRTRTETVVYTIGHSNHPIDRFIGLLRQHGITAIADVRSSPYSRHNPQFNRNALAAALRKAGIAYVFLGEELGARPKDPACYVDGRVDFGRLAARGQFKRGIERVLQGSRKYRLALMCAEREPLDCHRTILVCRHLRAGGVAIRHILADGSIEDHRQTEARLLKATGLEPTLFTACGDDSKALEQAYAQRAGEVAYRTEKEEPAHERG